MMFSERRLSIGIIAGSISRSAGGLFNSVRGSAKTLALEGCDVTVYGVSDAHTDEDRKAWAPLEPEIFRRLGPEAFNYAPGLARALMRSNHDVVHLHGLWQWPSIATAHWSRNTGRPVMISPRGMLDGWALRNSAWKKRLAGQFFERRNLQSAACLHALNASEQDAIRAFGLTNPIAVIPNGADLPTEGLPPPLSGSDGAGSKTLLFLGRLHPKKGLLELVEAWRRAEARLFDWRLVIAGWGEGRFVSELMSQTAQCQAITFVGPVHGVEKSSLLASSHAFILPSHSEGLPMAVLEAWAAGLPVFMTRACNLPEGFAAGAAIEISCDPDEMAEQLVRGLRERSLRSIGTRGRKLVADRFTWKAIGVAHIEVYNWMCRGGPPPRVVVPPQGLGGSNRVPAPG